MQKGKALQIVPVDIEAEIIACDEGLSFWGGVDPRSAVVIDAFHPLHGQSIAGKILVIPTSRGSCSGSGVLLQLALNDCAPAAIVFRDTEEILTLGALIATRMFEKNVGIVRVHPVDFRSLQTRKTARLSASRLVSTDLEIELDDTGGRELHLSDADESVLAGHEGAPKKLAMDIIRAMALSQGAGRLIDVTRAHVDGCIYAHEANLVFADTIAKLGAKVSIPTTINAISVDRENWRDQGVPPKFGTPASRLADAYVQMGAQPTFTCAPYLADDAPANGEQIGWSESNAVTFANSVLGARTAKHPDFLDLFIAMTGRAPETGVYLDEGRRPNVVIEIDLPQRFDDAFWPLLGWVAGQIAADQIPLLKGLHSTGPSRDNLRALCASFATTSAAPMLHIAGITPESDLSPRDGADRHRIAAAELVDAWKKLNSGGDTIDLVALGSPHFSLEETERFCQLMDQGSCSARIPVIITLGRETFAAASQRGYVHRLKEAGVRFHSDLCWCSMTEPVFPSATSTLMTNSGKYAHYAPGLSGRMVRFGSLADCARAAQTGSSRFRVPDWLAD